jgi:hypothetical protein
MSTYIFLCWVLQQQLCILTPQFSLKPYPPPFPLYHHYSRSFQSLTLNHFFYPFYYPLKVTLSIQQWTLLLSIALNFPFYCSDTPNPPSLPILLMVKLNPRINIVILSCPYLPVYVSLLIPSILTHFNIYWLSSSKPSFLNHPLLILKLPSFPAIYTSYIILPTRPFPLSPSHCNPYYHASPDHKDKFFLQKKTKTLE